MEERLAQMESRLDEACTLLEQVERRLLALEGGAASAPGPDEVTAAERRPALAREGAGGAATVTLLGRSLLVFGGAYLLRALTDLGLMPQVGGIVAGLLYALLWLVLADYAAARQRRASSAFHGAAGILIAFALLWEATTRFALLSPWSASAAIAGVSTLALAVAVRRRLRSLAWLVTGGAAVTAFALLRATHAPLPLISLLLALGVGVLWASYAGGWAGLPWLAAVAADLAIVLPDLLVGGERFAMDPRATAVLGLAFAVAYLGSCAARTLAQGRNIGVFEVTQGTLAVLLGFATAIRAVVASPSGTMAVAASGLLLGLGGYAVAFSPGMRHVRRLAFFFYTSVGLALVVTGTWLLLPGSAAAAAWSALAVVLAWLSGRFSRVTLSLHSSLYLIAAAVASGQLAAAIHAFLGSPSEPWPALTFWHLAVVGATGLCLLVPVARQSQRWGRLAWLPGLLAILLALVGFGGSFLLWLVPVVGMARGGVDAGAVAALRTAVLASSAVGLGWAGRKRRYREAWWVVYPLLVLAGIKLVVEDLPQGRPLTLFPALALLGGALIAASRLVRRSTTGPAAP